MLLLLRTVGLLHSGPHYRAKILHFVVVLASFADTKTGGVHMAYIARFGDQ